jgi:NAD-reducing hydrogenase large subunit
MGREIRIDPVTRIEGHAKITITLDDAGEVADAHFHVTQFRGFERLCQGRPVEEMPSLMARICGICPVSHLIASAKAGDQILAVEPPPAAERLRRVLNLAQLVQSHALSFFHLSSPDLLFGFDADPATRNLIGVLQESPQLARDGIALRRFGQQVVEGLGGKRVHPGWVVAGGVEAPLSVEVRDQILDGLPEALAAAERGLAWYTANISRFDEESAVFASFPSAYLGLVAADGSAEHYDGGLRAVRADGTVLFERADPRPYAEYLGEAVEPWSFLKSPYLLELGYPDGLYRVGPLARVVVADRFGTPRADAALQALRDRVGRVPQSAFHYHEARLIEVLFGLERMGELLTDPETLSDRVRSHATPNRNEGIGVAEAPRGTLIHHYRVDDDGLVEWANLIVATGHNNLAMNRGVLQVARHFVRDDQIQEGMLNRVEAVIRCFDPCLSCSTHALGSMPMRVELFAADGVLLDEQSR